DEHGNAVTRYGGKRLERRDGRPRPRGGGLRALDVEGRGESCALTRCHQAQRFIVRGRYRAHAFELAQRACEHEGVGGDGGDAREADAPGTALGRMGFGSGCRSPGTETAGDVDFPRDSEPRLPALRVRGLRDGSLRERVVAGPVIEARAVNPDARI